MIFQANLAEDSHEKNQALFSSKDKIKKLQCRLLQFLFGALGVNIGMLALSYRFVAISGMDAEFERVDINQCPTSEGNPAPNLFAGTHRCRPTTMVSIS